MNKMYATRNEKTVDNKENAAVRQARLLAEREKATKEKSENIVDYYANGRQGGVRV